MGICILSHSLLFFEATQKVRNLKSCCTMGRTYWGVFVFFSVNVYLDTNSKGDSQRCYLVLLLSAAQILFQWAWWELQGIAGWSQLRNLQPGEGTREQGRSALMLNHAKNNANFQETPDAPIDLWRASAAEKWKN